MWWNMGLDRGCRNPPPQYHRFGPSSVLLPGGKVGGKNGATKSPCIVACKGGTTNPKRQKGPSAAKQAGGQRFEGATTLRVFCSVLSCACIQWGARQINCSWKAGVKKRIFAPNKWTTPQKIKNSSERKNNNQMKKKATKFKIEIEN